MELAKQALYSRRAIAAAGIYEDPITPLNNAAFKYADLVTFNLSEDSSKYEEQSNESLYEEWKQIFGKIEEEPKE